MDIALLSEFRKQGIGTVLLQNILAEAAENSLPVTIHVERFNPALKLYQRLGFSIAEDKGVYLFMRWSATRKEEHETAGSIAEH
jgi:ribosomal protein S18 acetylase RimI-like enzyme